METCSTLPAYCKEIFSCARQFNTTQAFLCPSNLIDLCSYIVHTCIYIYIYSSKYTYNSNKHTCSYVLVYVSHNYKKICVMWLWISYFRCTWLITKMYHLTSLIRGYYYLWKFYLMSLTAFHMNVSQHMHMLVSFVFNMLALKFH